MVCSIIVILDRTCIFAHFGMCCMCLFNRPTACPIAAAASAAGGGGAGARQRNIKPMTRAERRALKDKVALEKGRLLQVSGRGIPRDDDLRRVGLLTECLFYTWYLVAGIKQ